MTDNPNDLDEPRAADQRWVQFLFPSGHTGTAAPLVALELGAIATCMLALLWRGPAAAARPTIPLAISAVLAAVAAGHESATTARQRLWVAAAAMWLGVAMIALEIVSA